MPGLSETIRVRSVVDRFLEHSRIYVFGPDDDARIYLSSADWMPRNFFRRVEAMFPVEAPELTRRILGEILPIYLADNTRARTLEADGTFRLLHPGPGEIPRRCQYEFLDARTPEAVELPTRTAANRTSGRVRGGRSLNGQRRRS